VLITVLRPAVRLLVSIAERDGETEREGERDRERKKRDREREIYREGSGFRVSGVGFRDSGFGLRDSGIGVRDDRGAAAVVDQLGTCKTVNARC